MKIEGGYILQPRSWDASRAAHYPPVVRELWFFLLRNVNHADNEVCKRGEGYFSLEQIQNALQWKVGYRVMKYSKPQLTKSLRRLREGNMIATPKATHGIFVSIINYDTYQTPENYEGNDEEITKDSRKKSCGNANKNDKECKKEEEEDKSNATGSDHENEEEKKGKRTRKSDRKKIDFSEKSEFKNPGFSSAFCAGKWQQWCVAKKAPYRAQEVAEEALSYLYELSQGNEEMAAEAIKDAMAADYQTFKWYFAHNGQQKKHDHATTNTHQTDIFQGAYPGTSNLQWLESHNGECDTNSRY